MLEMGLDQIMVYGIGRVKTFTISSCEAHARLNDKIKHENRRLITILRNLFPDRRIAGNIRQWDAVSI